MSGIQRYSNFLDVFHRQFPPRPERLPTLMEIAGYPHYENVCSNILAFFFDPNEPHGLETLFLKALARAGDIDHEEGMMDAEVHREVTTNTGKRIDLLILSDSHAVLIENKIFAGLGNPWPEYAAFLARKKQTHKRKFLLTLTRTNAGKDQDFRNITYQELVSKIRGLIGNYVAEADTRYLTFMLDFLNTLEYLQGDMQMDQEFLKFLQNDADNAADFLKAYERLRHHLESKVNELYDELGNARLRGRDFAQDRLERSKQYKRRKDPLKRAVLYKIKNSPAVPDTEVRVIAVITPSGWEVQVVLKDGNNANNQELLGQQLQQLKELTDLELHFSLNGGRFILDQSELADFSCNADLEHSVFPVVRSVVCRLAAGIPGGIPAASHS